MTGLSALFEPAESAPAPVPPPRWERLKVSMPVIRLMFYKEFKGKKGPEDVIGIAFANELRAWTIEGRLTAIWGHIPNEIAGGGINAKIRYALAKALGLIKGAPDYFFLWEGGCGVLELKDKKGTQDPTQKDYETWCTERGVPYKIIRSVEEGKDALLEWGVLLPR